jgi:hypothetical protein
MPGRRLTSRWLRVALAVAFGFMNLGHGPIMTFAHAGQRDAAPASVSAQHGHGQHGHASHRVAADEDDGPAASPEQPTACNAFGCFITVAAFAVVERQPVLLPIGKLHPEPRPAGTPDTPEPADPPPRLHV